MSKKLQRNSHEQSWVRPWLCDFNQKIDSIVKPVYTSLKIKEQFKLKEHKSTNHCLFLQVWSMMHLDYVGFTSG